MKPDSKQNHRQRHSSKQQTAATNSFSLPSLSDYDFFEFFRGDPESILLAKEWNLGSSLDDDDTISLSTLDFDNHPDPGVRDAARLTETSTTSAAKPSARPLTPARRLSNEIGNKPLPPPPSEMEEKRHDFTPSTLPAPAPLNIRKKTTDHTHHTDQRITLPPQYSTTELDNLQLIICLSLINIMEQVIQNKEYFNEPNNTYVLFIMDRFVLEGNYHCDYFKDKKEKFQDKMNIFYEIFFHK